MRLSSNKLLLLLSFVFFFLYSTVVHVFASPQYGPDNVDLDPSCSYTDPTCTVGQMEFKDEGISITTEPISIDFVGSGVALTEGLDGVLTVTIPGGGITIDSSAITGGAANQILFESAGNLVTEDADFTYNGFASGYLNVGTGYSIDGNFFATQDTSTSSIRIGNNAGNDSMNGNANTVIGNNAGNDLTTGYMNTFLGANSGAMNTSGGGNVFLGSYSGSINSTGATNTFVGVSSGEVSTTGSNNAFLGYYSGFRNTTGATNTFVGVSSGESNTTGAANVFIGYQAGKTQISDYQVAIGHQALSGLISSTGTTNTAIGYRAGYAITSGASNAFVGHQSGWSITSGSNNAFLGYQSGAANATGSGNVFLGYVAGASNIGGSSNIYIGSQAGQFVTAGSSNIYIGSAAGQPSSGNDNVFVGSFAGALTTTGDSNTYIGTSAGYTDITNGVTTADGITNAAAIGYKAQVGASNSLVLGGMGTNAVNIGIGDITPDYRLDIEYASDGIVASFDDSDSGSCTVDPGDGDFSCSSDERLKHNINDLESSLDIVRTLRPVRYNWNSDEDGDPTKIGFIAQEVDEVLPEFVTVYKNGYLGLNYAGFTPVLTKAIQELDVNILNIQEFTDQTFISKLQEWLGSVSNGLEKLYAGKVETYEVQTDKLCVGSRCITESEFIELLDTNNIGGTEDSDEDQDELLDDQENDENILVEGLTDEELGDILDESIEEFQSTEQTNIEDQQEEVSEDDTEDIEEVVIQEEGGQVESEITQ